MGLLLFTLMMTTNPTQPSTTSYFPPEFAKPIAACKEEKGNGWPIVSDFESQWFSRHLSAAGEPSLWNINAGEVIRFTWLRTFHNPITVRVTFGEDGAARLIARQLSGAGGYEPGSVTRSIDRLLRPQEVYDLRDAIGNTKIFDLPSRECRVGMDGAEWIVEANGPDGYQFLKRWTPRQGAVHEIGLIMVRLTGWDVGEIY